MRNIWAITKRELGEYFTTPVGYIVVGTFAGVIGLAFAVGFIKYADISVSPGTYGQTGVPDIEETLLSPMLIFMGQVIMFLGPLITMRLIAEEKNRGTMELLLTYPLRDRDIVFGKYFAGLGVLLVMTIVVAIHMCTAAYYTDVEPGVFVLGVLAVFLMGAAFISMGLFISALMSNQITAATVTFGVWFISYIIGSISDTISEVPPVAEEAVPLRVYNAISFLWTLGRNFLIELPIDAHAKTMAQGVLQLKDIVYYVVFIAFFLFLTFRALESRKWRAA